MMLKRPANPHGVNPEFYRRRYADLRHMSDAEAIAHYGAHGHLEGRRPSADARFEISPLASDLPPLFSVGEYKRLNPDVAEAAVDDWEVCVHYVRHGRGERRRYTELDPRFYWQMYLHDRPFDIETVGEHFRSHEGRPGVFRSQDAMLEYYGAKRKGWLRHFSDRAFSLMNFNWLGEMLEGPRALARFLDEGIDRVAPFSFSKRFDLDFYRELHPLLSGAPAAMAYRHWLFKGLDVDEPGEAADWLKHIGLALTEYPSAFSWREYAVGRLTKDDTHDRWSVLKHLIENAKSEPTTWPLVSEGADRFLLAMARLRQGKKEFHSALACLERATAMGFDNPEISHAKADACHAMKLWGEGFAHYEAFHASGRSTLWSIVLSAECAMNSGDHDGALRVLLKGKAAHGGDQPWLSMLDAVVTAQFESATVRARALYANDRRKEGDVHLAASSDWMVDAWSNGLDLPAPLPERKRKVVILANQSLPQCTHYRVEQKTFLLEAAGYEIEIFDWGHSAEFLAALPDACAAIFYRLPAFPQVVKAILSARAQGVVTYYEIDDLIFDPAHYPDPFESFQGQISWEVYQGLIYGTTLYRSAMRLCDYGIASTTPLAAAMEHEVREKRCFVLRNGLDPRNLGLETPLSVRRKAEGRLRIVYGSATLAHNQDFHDMAGAALRNILDRHPGVELCIIGHLELGDAFEGYGDRLIRVELLKDPRAYWALLAECDINLAVLAPSRMADCKSEIKWLEAAVLGIPSVLSATATYREVVEDGVTALLAETPQDWEAALEQLVVDSARRLQMGQEARRAALDGYSVEAGASRIHDLLRPAIENLGGRDKKRILLVNVFFAPQSIGGATRVVADNLNHLRETDQFDFAVATSDYDARPAYSRRTDSYEGVPVFRISPPFEEDLDWKPVDEKMAEWFRDVLSQFQPDLVHFHCVQRLTSSVVDVCREQNIPYFVSVHDGWWLSDYQFLFDEEARMRMAGDELTLGPKPSFTITQTLSRLGRLRQSLDGAREILAPSERFTSIYRDAGFGKTRTVSNGISEISPLQKQPSSTRRVRLAHIGDTSPHKGFDLVEAVIRQHAFNNLELLALSHGRGEHEVAEEVWGSTPVRLAGRIAQNRIAHLYASIDVLLAPSAWMESYGLVTREANAAGVWVVASDRGAIGEDIRPGIDGFVIDVSSPTALADALGRIDRDPERYLQPAPVNPAVGTSRGQAEELRRIYEAFFGAAASPGEGRAVSSA